MLEALEEKFPVGIAWKIFSYCRHPTAELLDDPIKEWLKYRPMSYKGTLQFNHYIANVIIYSSLLKQDSNIATKYPYHIILSASPMIVPRTIRGDFQFLTCISDGIVHEFWRYKDMNGVIYTRRYILSRPCRD
jgi:hypothetical protein